MAGKKGKSKKKVRFADNHDDEEEDDDDPCNCICGDNDFSARRPWIECTGCGEWQHNDCIGVSVFDDELPDQFWCQKCVPEEHVELLAAIERGEKPWEARNRERLTTKAQFEQQISSVLEQLHWLRVLPSTAAGSGAAISPDRRAPAPYVQAVQEALKVLFEDLPMHSLRDLANQLDPQNGRQGTIKLLRKKAAPEYDNKDFSVLGMLTELFEWAEPGTLYDDSSS